MILCKFDPSASVRFPGRRCSISVGHQNMSRRLDLRRDVDIRNLVISFIDFVLKVVPDERAKLWLFNRCFLEWLLQALSLDTLERY